ncbi:MAG TPA: BTAD domain-containing putative transcriptional regulator [Pseudonocardia sp.]|nr:BTAD domain-containing putative transcriptional regulator [Pseudonocardia sp.]
MGTAGTSPPVRVEVLGPLRLVVDGAPVEVPGAKRRAVLALLALAEGRTVTVDHLLDALGPGGAGGRQALHSHVSRLRAHLGPAASRLQTRPDGYRLELGTADLDVAHARSLVAQARATADPGAALALLREAHALWRGPALTDLTDVAAIATAVEGCAQLRRAVTDALVDSAVRAGDAQAVLDLAAEALAADPLREPAVLLLMRALTAAGRAPEALRTGREFRHRLADETGLDPSPALGELERAVAAGTAGPPPRRSPEPARPATRLIGRDPDVAALHRVLAAERLVTVAGPGGVGKTRVAAEVARGSAAATALLLARVTEPPAVPHVLAAALDLAVVHGDVLAACASVLGDRPGLLVIDNCEHLLDAVRDTVDVLLSACPGLTVLTTSREPLGLPAEYVYRLSPLPLPGPGAADGDLPHVPSVALFLDRARRVRPGPPPPDALRTVAEIVRRLDGVPLAIELAAGRLSTFSVTDLQQRLDRSLDLLGGAGADARHRTLRATLDWSYRLLGEDERRLFRHLSVFVDGVDLDTAERLAADLGLAGDPGTALARLVDASMIDASMVGAGFPGGAGTRYRMLETLRAFGLDRLAAEGEGDAAAAALIGWAVRLTTWIGATLETEREPEADAALRRELPNLRAAWRLARTRGSHDEAVAMVTALFDAVLYRDLLEVRGWAEELADDVLGDPQIAARPGAAAVLGGAAEAAYHRGEYPRAERLARAGLDRATDRAGRWPCLAVLTVVELARGAHADVVEHSLTAAALVGPHRENLGIAALASAYAGDVDRARGLNDEALARAVSPSMRAWGAYVAGEIEGIAGRGGIAEQHYVRAVELARGCGATFLVGVATVGLLTVRADAGRVADALRGYREVIDYFARTGNWAHLWVTLRNLARLLHRVGDDAAARLLLAAADRAPDAPADDRRPVVPPLDADAPVPGRSAVLDAARTAIRRALERS